MKLKIVIHFLQVAIFIFLGAKVDILQISAIIILRFWIHNAIRYFAKIVTCFSQVAIFVFLGVKVDIFPTSVIIAYGSIRFTKKPYRCNAI